MSFDPARSWQLTVVQDYGQFYLCSVVVDAGERADISAAVETAIDTDGIAQAGALTVVLSPHQNNFAMSLHVQLWSSPPPDDLAAWQEAFEATLDIDEGGLIYDNVDGDSHLIPIPRGRYLARITGRGFVARGWPGSTEPGDEWRIQLVATPTRVPPRRLSAWDNVPTCRSPSR